MSLIGVTASGSSPEVMPLRPFQEAATSVPSITSIEISARPRLLAMWTLAAIPAALAPAPTTIRSYSDIGVGPRLGDDEAMLGRTEGDRAPRHPLRARLDRLQLDLLEHGAQYPLHLLFGVAGGEAAAGAAAEGNPGRHRGALGQEALGDELIRVLVDVLAVVDQV